MGNINDYKEERFCIYKNEYYHVRDNGAVMRLTPEGKKPRSLDSVWTFGKKSSTNGYMTIGNHRVHIIVATAFYGPNDSKVYVVDHIDTNRCNNRVENLRWLTKLENILLNEITRKKIERICGSIESFLENPSQLKGYESQDRNFEWMRAVSKEEAENTLMNWNKLITRPQTSCNSGTIGDWIFEKTNNPQKPFEGSFFKKIDSSNLRENTTIIKENLTNDSAKQDETPIVTTSKDDKMKNTAALKKFIKMYASSKGWSILPNVKRNNWKADFLITDNEVSVAINLYKRTRNISNQLHAMETDNVEGYWLGNDLYPDFEGNITPSFPILQEENSSEYGVTISDGHSYDIGQFLDIVMNKRLKIENNVTIDAVKVRFMPTTCYKCKRLHHVYMIVGLLSKEDSSLSTYEGMYKSQTFIDKFDSDVINSVCKFLSNNRHLGYNLGDIKERHSETMDASYMSFGCPWCNAIVGEHYQSDMETEYCYEKDDENVYSIELEHKITLEHKHWIVEL